MAMTGGTMSVIHVVKLDVGDLQVPIVSALVGCLLNMVPMVRFSLSTFSLA